jgi:type I restriction enzyme, S subunit
MSGLPKGWKELSIGEVILPFRSIDPTKEPSKEFRYIDIGSIDNSRQAITDPKSFKGKDAPSRARRIVQEGDVLFSTVRTYLKNIATVPSELSGALTSTGISVLRPSARMDSRYLFHWVTSDAFVTEISKSQDGTMYPAVSDLDVSSSRIAVPPVTEQRRIVVKIDSLTGCTARAREELERIPRLMQKYRDAILSAAFSGELTREWRAITRAKGIPLLEWTRPTLGSLVIEGPTNGWSPPSAMDGRGAKTLKLTATTSGYLRLDAEAIKRINVTPPANSRYWLRPGDLLLQRGNTIDYVGTAAIYDGPEHAYIYPDLMMRVRLPNSQLTRYVWRYVNSPAARSYFRSRATGTAGNMPKINGETVRALVVPLPPAEELTEILQRIDIAFAWLDRVTTEHANASRLLSKLDQAILAKAFRGELVLPECGEPVHSSGGGTNG